MSDAVWSFGGAIIVAVLNLVGTFMIQKAQSEKDNALQDERINQVKADVKDLRDKVEAHNQYGLSIAKMEGRISSLEQQIKNKG